MISRRVFLDADVLAAPMTRTVLVLASLTVGARFAVCWSLAAEAEADQALREGQTRVAELRQRFDWGTDVLVPDGDPDVMSGLTDTSPNDRHILAAAARGHVPVVVTRNVHDFGVADLRRLGMCTVHPDLFLSRTVSSVQYEEVLRAMAAGRLLPPNTPDTLHAALGAGHPRLFEAMHMAFPGVESLPSTDARPLEVYRGDTCFLCGKILTDPESRASGTGPECRVRQTA